MVNVLVPKYTVCRATYLADAQLRLTRTPEKPVGTQSTGYLNIDITVAIKWMIPVIKFII